MNDACETPRCPRCDREMAEPMVRNAVSRLDNQTYICSQCGVDEAVFERHHVRDAVPDPLPPLNRPVFEVG